ncbi:hypothetical protein [Streptomyces sp. NPDC053079]|uniref:hypothetical protein n=1 Tax=Streptomyces sp. NPDC053079 TaxID=3365697 RepID=UPI0037CE7EC5
MRAEFASVAAGSDRPNGNWVGVTASAVALLDGDGSGPGTEQRVALLGSAVLGRLADPALTVESCLTEATVEAHRPPDDPLDVRHTPPPRLAAAVARVIGDELEWAVVHDAVVILDLPSGLRVITGSVGDDGRPTSGEPVFGRTELDGVRQVAMLSSGAARLVTFGIAVWEQVIYTLAKDGPQVLIDEVRQFEAVDRHCQRWPRSATTDDATAVLLRF